MDRLRFATHLAPNVEPVYAAIAEHVGRRLGVRTELVVATSYDRCERDLDEVCFVCSLPYVTLARAGRAPGIPVAAPVLAGARYGGRPIYFSDVIVRTDARARSFDDLRGARFAYNEPLSHSGYGVVRHHLVRLGETDGFFGEVVEAGFHQESIRLVEEGKVDASAIDSQVLEIEMRDRPELRERLRVIETIGPSTIQPVVVSRRVPPPLREAVRGALIEMGDRPEGRAALAPGLIERFASVDDADYADIRAMLEACERAGFTELR